MAAPTTQQESDIKTATISGEVKDLSPVRHTKSKREPVVNFELVSREYDDAGEVKEEDKFQMSCYGSQAEQLAEEASDGRRVKVNARPQEKRNRWVKDKGKKAIFSDGNPRKLKEVVFIVDSWEILPDEEAAEDTVETAAVS